MSYQHKRVCPHKSKSEVQFFASAAAGYSGRRHFFCNRHSGSTQNSLVWKHAEIFGLEMKLQQMSRYDNTGEYGRTSRSKRGRVRPHDLQITELRKISRSQHAEQRLQEDTTDPRTLEPASRRIWRSRHAEEDVYKRTRPTSEGRMSRQLQLYR